MDIKVICEPLYFSFQVETCFRSETYYHSLHSCCLVTQSAKVFTIIVFFRQLLFILFSGYTFHLV